MTYLDPKCLIYRIVTSLPPCIEVNVLLMACRRTKQNKIYSACYKRLIYLFFSLKRIVWITYSILSTKCFCMIYFLLQHVTKCILFTFSR